MSGVEPPLRGLRGWASFCFTMMVGCARVDVDDDDVDDDDHDHDHDDHDQHNHQYL